MIRPKNKLSRGSSVSGMIASILSKCVQLGYRSKRFAGFCPTERRNQLISRDVVRFVCDRMLAFTQIYWILLCRNFQMHTMQICLQKLCTVNLFS